MNTYPIVREISYIDPTQLVAVSPREGLLFLDSRNTDLQQGRYSFLAISPFKMWVGDEDNTLNPFEVIENALKTFSLPRREELPPFQGGIAGMFGYELGRYLENLPPPKSSTLIFPDCIIGFYDLVFSWDHLLKRAWIVSSGYPHQEESDRYQRAKSRIEWALSLIDEVKALPTIHELNYKPDDFRSNFHKEDYIEAVNRVKEYIRAGDIFEANISQCFSAKWPNGYDPFELYRIINNINPAPFSAYLEYRTFSIISASPERFLKMQKHQIEARPIKGTRRRDNNIEKDEQNAKALLSSEKDRAENVMIVDLMRNDLSRVCSPHTVNVSQLCGLESFASVHHLVSVIEGQLKPELCAMDLIKATFPGGSVTGAPKIRAMEIIHEIESVARGPYCGSMGYIGFNGDLDLSITIRTIVKSDNQLAFQVGGAVTIDSDPNEEYDETLVKASRLQCALMGKD